MKTIMRLWALCQLVLFHLGDGHLEADPREREPKNEEEAIIELSGLHLEEFGESGPSLELWSPKAKYSRKDKLVELGGVRVVVSSVSKGSSRSAEITARGGKAELGERVVHLRGNVRVLTEDGYELKTEEAIYDYEARELEGPGEVYLVGPEGMTKGEGAHLWLDEEIVVLRRSVHTFLRPEAIQRAREKVKR